MKTVSVSTFKAKCLALLAEVGRTREPILVTRRGIPLAQVDPPEVGSSSGFGCMKGTGTIVGDIVEADFSSEWEVLK